MRDPLAVFVYARDPLCQAGMLAMLHECPGVCVVEANDIDRARVAIVVAEVVTVEVARVIRAVQRGGVPRVLAVISRVDEDAVVHAVTAGASAILKWSNADPRRLAAAIGQVASAEELAPRQLMARLLTAARAIPGASGGDHGPAGAAGPAGDDRSARSEDRPALSERDLAVLRLVAEGLDTAEVAERLAYSESTIKGVLHGVMARLDARNRSHAVAVALRGGLI